jgi:hypothetical protein
MAPRVRGQGYTATVDGRRTQPGSAQPQSLPILTALFLESIANHRHRAAKFTHTAEELVMAPEASPKALQLPRMHTPLSASALHRDSCDCFVTVRHY